MWGEANSPIRIVMQFCTGEDIGDVVTPANFGSHRFRRFRMAEVEFQAFPLTFNAVFITLALRCSVWKSCSHTTVSYMCNILQYKYTGVKLWKISTKIGGKLAEILRENMKFFELTPVKPSKFLPKNYQQCTNFCGINTNFYTFSRHFYTKHLSQ